MAYSIYLASNLSVPFVIINDDIINTTATSLQLVGQDYVGYGTAQNQNFVFMLQNFANGTPPSNPLNGQLWYDTINDELRVYDNESVWNVVGAPTAGPSGPPNPVDGQLWFNTATQVLEAWNGTTWVIIGPSQQLAPANVYKQTYSSNITTNGNTTELFVNGVTGSRLVIPNNTTWTFESTISAKLISGGQVFAGWKIKGVINNTSGSIIFSVLPAIETYGTYASASNWSVNATADLTNTSLDLFVTGSTGNTVNWTAVTTITIA
jgi:hypothetical protein